MTRQAIEERIKELESQADQLRANLNAITGAIHDCQYWLSQIVEAAQHVEERQE